MPTLRRIRDGKGDSGERIQSILLNSKNELGKVVANRPLLGCCLLVGDNKSKIYGSQDYHVTSPIKDILIERSDYVKFVTENSIYELFY